MFGRLAVGRIRLHGLLVSNGLEVPTSRGGVANCMVTDGTMIAILDLRLLQLMRGNVASKVGGRGAGEGNLLASFSFTTGADTVPFMAALCLLVVW